MKKTIVIAVMLAVAAVSLNAEAGKWKLALNKNGIKVYTRPAKGCPLDEFMGVTVINAPIETCVRVLRDVDSQPRWMGDCLEAKLLKRISKDHLIAYNVIDVPWPLSNRDLQIDTRFITNLPKGIVTVKMAAYVPAIQPVTKKYVRITDMKATCIMKKINDNKTRVTYINRVNPMAPIPDSVANMFAKKNPYKTLLGMRKMVKLPKYAK